MKVERALKNKTGIPVIFYSGTQNSCGLNVWDSAPTLQDNIAISCMLGYDRIENCKC